MWASTLWPFSSSTRNMAFGNGSTTVPSRTIASSLGLGRADLRDWFEQGARAARGRGSPAQSRRERLSRLVGTANSGRERAEHVTRAGVDQLDHSVDHRADERADGAVVR